ncbi:UDP-N-acetylmuramoyl-L-alanine--D-glutamate ligase [Thermodesulfobacteriota bacterium]
MVGAEGHCPILDYCHRPGIDFDEYAETQINDVEQMELAGKHILIVGFGITGSAVAQFLKHRGAAVTITDMASETQLGDYAALARQLKIKLELGRHDPETFASADLIVLSPGVPHTIPPIKKAREKGIPVLGEIELAAKFIEEPIIAVTGTNGKTTTTALLGEMLWASGQKVFVGGNIGNPLIAYVDQGEKAQSVVVELSSFQLDTIETFRPAVSVLLNISEDHLDRYPDFRAYAASKCRIFQNQQREDTAILNGADTHIRSMTRNIAPAKMYFNSSPGDENGASLLNGQLVINLGEKFPDHLKLDLSGIRLKGRHNFENICAASLAALTAGGTWEGVASALNHFKGLPHRLEYVDSVNNVRFFNDSKATNVDAVARALTAFDDPLILIMGGQDKGGNFQALKDMVRRTVKQLIVIGEAAQDIKTALDHTTSIKTAETMEEAVMEAYHQAIPGDVVLLSPACASFDMYRNYAHRGEIFCNAVKGLK